MKPIRLRNPLLVGSVILLISACLISSAPPGLPVTVPPHTSGESCFVTVVRAAQWTGAAIPFTYVTLDDVNVARLARGDYTKFSVEPGHHTIGVRWRIGALSIVAPWGVGNVPTSPEFSKAVEFECRPGEDYFFGNRLKTFAVTDVGRMDFQQLSDLGEDFQLGEKRFIYPGMAGEE